MATPQLLVMAAGIGSRYGGLKQIDPIGPSGEIIIDYSIHDAVKAGFEKVVFIIRKDIEDAFREKIGAHIEGKIETEYVFQELDALPVGYAVPKGRAKPWGTGHAVLCAKDAIDAPFAVINADDFYGARSFEGLFKFLKDVSTDTAMQEYCMVGYILDNTLTDHGHVARGVCTTTNEGYLDTIVERTKIQRFGGEVRYTEDGENWVDIDKQSTVSMNMFGFTPAFMDELAGRFPAFLDKNLNTPKAEYFMPTVVNNLIQEGKARVTVVPTPERWLGVTYREDRETVKNEIAALVENGVYPANLRG